MLDVKSAVDDKLSLLHFVVQEFEQSNPDITNLADDFSTLEAASRGSNRNLKLFFKTIPRIFCGKFCLINIFAIENMTMLAGDLNKLKGGFSKCDGILKNPNSDPKFKDAVSVSLFTIILTFSSYFKILRYCI